MLRLLLCCVAAGFVPFIISESLARSLPATAWWCAVGSGVFCGSYFLFLGLGYEAGDFTVVYPVARALPVLLVGVGDVFRGHWPSAPGWLGMVLVVLGCALAPMHSFRELSWRRYASRATLWMVLTALGTVGYTLLDKTAAGVVTRGPATAARYGYVFFFFALATYAPLYRLANRKSKAQRDTVGWRTPALGAVLNYGAYWLVLWAYQLSDRASYVVAFRQFSIVVGVVVAFVAFRERGLAVRLVATGILTAGLVVIGLFGGG